MLVANLGSEIKVSSLYPAKIPSNNITSSSVVMRQTSYLHIADSRIRWDTSPLGPSSFLSL